MSDRDVMKMALKALERARPQIRGVLPSQDADAAIAFLRARLAKPEPQTCKADLQVEGAEAVAYPEGDVVGPCVCGSWPGGKCLKCPRIAPPARLAQHEGAEPVVWMVFTQDGQSVFVTDNPTDIGNDQRALPLYTAPPTRRPLTDEEIDRITRDKWGDMLFSDVVEVHREFARAIERAHKIGGNDE